MGTLKRSELLLMSLPTILLASTPPARCSSAGDVISSRFHRDVRQQAVAIKAVQRENLNITLKGESSARLNTTFAFPEKGVSQGFPLLLFLNGLNCNSWEYSDFLDKLAEFGYLSVITDQRHEGRRGPTPPEPGCPQDSYLMTTPAILPSVRDFITQAVDGSAEVSADLRKALKQINADSVVLLGHSYGGRTAIQLLEGAEPSHTQSLLGALIFEGGRAREGEEEEVELPPGTFVSYMEGELNDANPTQHCYDQTQGCSDFHRFSGCNHYALNNFHAEREYMVAPCAPSNGKQGRFKTTAEQQGRIIDLLATTFHAEIQANVFQSKDWTNYIQNLKDVSDLVSDSFTDRACLPKDFQSA